MPQFFDIIMNAVQIILYMLIIVCFTKSRFLKRKYSKVREKNILNSFFDSPFYGIAVQEQVKQAFDNIVETITNERTGLENVIGINRFGKKNPYNPIASTESIMHAGTQLSQHTESHSIPEKSTTNTSPHDNVIKLSANGLMPKKISEDLEISIDEVELILSLHEKKL
jgi:hypothetical protein